MRERSRRRDRIWSLLLRLMYITIADRKEEDSATEPGLLAANTRYLYLIVGLAP